LILREFLEGLGSETLKKQSFK